jgi:DNA uptake protein ComE-like DNA-binding protein
MKRSLFPVLVCAALAACGDSGGSAAENAAETAPVAAPAAPAAPAATAPAPAAAPAAPALADGALLDPNSATREQLLAVPGMNAQLADALVAGRPYADMRAVDKVLAPTLGEEQRDQVYARVWKPIDLNTASKEEMLLIPGVGARMQHEFEEYRPYRAMEQFRREIGKYVDAGEVARLERYVTIAPAR